jgi:DNA-binding NtrC family response regulator
LLKLGAYAYVLKPFKLEEVEKSVEGALAERQRRLEEG